MASTQQLNRKNQKKEKKAERHFSFDNKISNKKLKQIYQSHTKHQTDSSTQNPIKMHSQTPQTPASDHVYLSEENIKQLHALSKRLCGECTTGDNEINAKRLRARGKQILSELNEIVIEN